MDDIVMLQILDDVDLFLNAFTVDYTLEMTYLSGGS